jgi:O-acetyl-ADP-ribose deacetylase (regulator of RNase III)
MILHMKPTDDIFKARTEAIVIPVNTEGIAGKGLALEFSQKCPESTQFYKTHLKQAGEICHLFGDPFSDDNLFFSVVIFAFTKDKWRDPSRLEWIESICDHIRNFAQFQHWDSSDSIAIPALGAGLGGLSWEDVKTVIENKLGDLNCTIYLYPPR